MSDTDWDEIQREVWLGVGAVACASANLEFVMYQLYCRLVGSPLAEIVATGEGFSFYYDRARNMLRYRSDMTLSDAQHVWTLLNRVRALMENRNHIIHGSWSPSAPGGPDQKHSVVLTRRSYKMPMREFSLNSMLMLASEMEEISIQIHEEVLDIFEGQFLDWDDEGRSPGVLSEPRSLE